MSAHPVSCGVLVVSREGKLLLCHVTHTAKWDIPKGMQEPGESTLEAAMRELGEETGIGFPLERFVDMGSFAYRPAKRLHLYKVEAGSELTTLDHLVCSSFFQYRVTGKPTPEVDAFRWASRDEVRTLCWPRMAQVLLSLDW
jgi:8-oxo-dGTP pyrophosphatase MutT (NUDIX family)